MLSAHRTTRVLFEPSLHTDLMIIVLTSQNHHLLVFDHIDTADSALFLIFKLHFLQVLDFLSTQGDEVGLVLFLMFDLGFPLIDGQILD